MGKKHNVTATCPRWQTNKQTDWQTDRWTSPLHKPVYGRSL